MWLQIFGRRFLATRRDSKQSSIKGQAEQHQGSLAQGLGVPGSGV